MVSVPTVTVISKKDGSILNVNKTDLDKYLSSGYKLKGEKEEKIVKKVKKEPEQKITPKKKPKFVKE